MTGTDNATALGASFTNSASVACSLALSCLHANFVLAFPTSSLLFPYLADRSTYDRRPLIELNCFSCTLLSTRCHHYRPQNFGYELEKPARHSYVRGRDGIFRLIQRNHPRLESSSYVTHRWRRCMDERRRNRSQVIFFLTGKLCLLSGQP